jgi:hypothetical protein
MKNEGKKPKEKQYIVRSKLWNFPTAGEGAIVQASAMGYSHLITAKNKTAALAKCEEQASAEAARTGARAWSVVKKCRLANAEDLRIFREVEF